MTSVQTLGIEPAMIGNPHQVPASADQVIGARHDIPLYSETCFLSSWNPDNGVGLFLHAGRCRQDVELWWAQALVYLPDGRIASDRSWGRSPDDHTVQTGNFVIRMDNPLHGWSSTFDGAAEITTAELMTRHPSGSGVARPMRWDFHTEAAGPVWDLYAALGRETRHDFAQGSHTQQVLHIRGSVVIDGTEYALDGHAANDHSSGVREMGNFGGHHFLVGALPGRTLHTISIFGMDGSELMTAGTEFRSTGDNPTLVLTDVPALDRLDTIPASFESTLIHDGEDTPIQIDVLHHVPISITTDNDNINGVDTDGPDLLVLSEARVLLTLPDGTVGHAHLERSTQRSLLAQT